MRKSLIPLALACWALLAAPALAEQEVIYFTNGTTMAIEAHSIEDGMVTVRLGEDSVMSFPVDQIDKIVTADGKEASPRADVNRIVPTTGAAVIHGEVPPRIRRGSWEGKVEGSQQGDNIGVDDKGVTVYRPFGSAAASNKRQFGVAGRRELRNQAPNRVGSQGAVGTSRIGSRYVLPPTMKGGRTRQPMGLGASPSPKTKNQSHSDHDKKQ